MRRLLNHTWWMLSLRGLFALIFGVLALIWPSLALTTLVLLFGAYMLLDGALATWAAFTSRQEYDRWWMVLIEGLAGIIAGVVALIWPGLTAFALLFLVAAWAIITGVMEIIAAIQLRKEIEGEWLMGLSGAISILFGALLFIWPGTGLLSLVWLIALYAILFGSMLIVLAFRVRNTDQKLDKLAGNMR